MAKYEVIVVDENDKQIFKGVVSGEIKTKRQAYTVAKRELERLKIPVSINYPSYWTARKL